VVTNEADRQQLTNRAVPCLAKIPIGSNIGSRTLTDEERQARRARWGYEERDLVLGYFGFLNRSKGGTTLIRTLHRLVQQGAAAHLLMIGERVGASDPTNHAYLQTVEALTADLALQERVQWTGHQSDLDVGADLNACDVLLMPYEDGASLRRGTLMAGLANGCAIITTTPQAPLPELVDGQDVLFVSPRDDRAAAEAVMWLANNREAAAALRRNARLCGRQFAWNRIARRHWEFYVNLR
jgi:glycosyltransferase involved in cell wall biosynthesis